MGTEQGKEKTKDKERRNGPEVKGRKPSAEVKVDPNLGQHERFQEAMGSKLRKAVCWTETVKPRGFSNWAGRP